MGHAHVVHCMAYPLARVGSTQKERGGVKYAQGTWRINLCLTTITVLSLPPPNPTALPPPRLPTPREICCVVFIPFCAVVIEAYDDGVATGACAAREGDSGGVQQLLHGEPGGQLQGQRLPVHAAGVRHGRRALHLPAGPHFSPPHTLYRLMLT